MAAMPEHLRPLMIFLYATGCRLGAALKIEWTQIVFNGKKVEVRLEASQVKNRTAMTLPLPDSLAKILRKQFQKEGPVFDSKNLRKAFQTAAVAVGLGKWRDSKNHDAGYDGIIIHDLRRSGVRNLVRAGVSETVAMQISGHKTRHVFQRYDITNKADLHDAMARVEKLVAKK
jgi:integrase